MNVLDSIYQLPLPSRICANGTAIGAAFATFFEKIQGPAAGVAAVLSAVWLGLQIFAWIRNEIRARRK
jgi:hypothetical protein